ncbi:Arginine transport system permease protein ArtQ [Lentibacillus sp. JNUCC-1]|uniref:amino acid ABC transporter permease n=1 Tax=Lentibacillus sp. JNUCC-1 TaxID=2654513 RepID=UPI0012E727EF|nr:amino acid ABC transporter permease [Lentibacillus sp. JNUCC-1]MUV38442.1 Arginine transport system permease protein ArtQ [Lentibacillus sp. JNUCC-1]
MSALIDIFPVLFQGVKITITVLLGSIVVGYLMAFIAGFCLLSNNIVLRLITRFYIEIFRGTSLIVQLFLLYYALPMLFNFDLGSNYLAGVLAISLNYGAYMAEVVRGSIESVAQGQREAATALNMSRFQRMRLVVFPQAVRMMLPEFGNYLIQMIKATSLVSLIGMKDILYYGDRFRFSDISMTPLVFLMVLIFYFIIALPLIFLTRKMEEISKKGVAS